MTWTNWHKTWSVFFISPKCKAISTGFNKNYFANVMRYAVSWLASGCIFLCTYPIFYQNISLLKCAWECRYWNKFCRSNFRRNVILTVHGTLTWNYSQWLNNKTKLIIWKNSSEKRLYRHTQNVIFRIRTTSIIVTSWVLWEMCKAGSRWSIILTTKISKTVNAKKWLVSFTQSKFWCGEWGK